MLIYEAESLTGLVDGPNTARLASSRLLLVLEQAALADAVKDRFEVVLGAEHENRDRNL